MNLVFADTLYWIALFVPGDSWSEAATAADLSGVTLVTTESREGSGWTGNKDTGYSFMKSSLRRFQPECNRNFP